MTDNDIIKALECCCKNNNCEGCPLDFLTFSSQCASELSIKSLDLINRQQAEIDQWKEEANKHQNLWCEAVVDIETAKAEAYKECIEKIQNQIKNNNAISANG